MKRVSYDLCLNLFNQKFTEVIIDQHYFIKHKDLNDDLILKILLSIPSDVRCISTQEKLPYEFFVLEPIYFEKKPYRIILIREYGFGYLGVVNIFRVRGKKYGISKRK